MSDSLKERLAAKRLRSASYPLAVGDTTEAEAAAQRARSEHQTALFTGDDLDEAKAALEEAEARLGQCYEWLTVRALKPADFEALIDAHPPRDDEKDKSWHVETFRPALIAACVDGDMSEEDWTEFLTDSCSHGERDALFLTALNVNTRPPDTSVPKGSTPTIS